MIGTPAPVGAPTRVCLGREVQANPRRSRGGKNTERASPSAAVEQIFRSGGLGCGV